MSFTTRHTLPSYSALGKIGEGTAARDRIEAADRKRIVAAFRAGRNPYEEIQKQQPETVEKSNAQKFNLGD
jgi:hypothetical protein